MITISSTRCLEGISDRLMCNLTFKDDKMLSFCMKIDSLSAMLNEFEMHSVFC